LADTQEDELMTAQVCNGRHFLEALQSATSWFEQELDGVNALNVFPVPDGDTGTNMHLTMVAAIKDVAPADHLGQVAERIYKNALMGARGNSGVILSQILRGLAQGLGPLESARPADLVAALGQAATTAYKAVMKPVEGTLLTVIRELAEGLAPGEQADFRELLTGAAQAARASVDRTPTLLKTLRDAGVVDAGGYGLLVLVEGARRYVCGETLVQTQVAARVQAPTIAFKDIHGPDDFGYCTNFLLEGQGIPFERVRETIGGMGASAVIVGDDTTVKVHIHALRPGDVLNFAVQYGELSHIEITNMDHQRRDLHQAEAQAAAPSKAGGDEPASAVGVVAVAPGEGLRRIFESMNVGAVIAGGQTMNPSIQDLVQAVEALPQREVIILPNNSNILLAARQVSELTSKRVEVVPSKTLPQGIAAMMAFNYVRSFDDNVGAMGRALRQVKTAEITTAVRDATVNDVVVKAGQTIGLLDDLLVESGDSADAVIDAILGRMELDEAEVLTIYYGGETNAQQAQALAERIAQGHPDLAVEVKSGGQPFYDYILSAE
jgi:DAK2 domain fusion protein YloV